MEELIKDYQNLYTIKELSKKYHITQGDVKKILKNKDIYIRTAAETWILKRNKGFSLEQIESIVVDNYVNKKFGQLKSGRQFGLSDRTVKNILLKNNIQIRNLHESICVANQTNDRTTQHYEKNSNFFKEENSNMAWLLGFLASDGNISKNENRIRIELSVVDREILERIKEIVKIENPIKIRENKRGFVFASLEWSCAEHKKDLEKYNIIPQKTYTLLPPTKLNEKFYIDYIRGYFDGDGTINLNLTRGGKSKSLRWGICGASKPVLEWIIGVLEERYNIPSVNIHKDSSHEKDFYSFVYSTNATRKIYDILYTNNSLFLKRKREKYEKLLLEVPIKE